MTIIVNPSGGGQAQASLLQNVFPSAIDGQIKYPFVNIGTSMKTVAADGTGDYYDIQSALNSGSGMFYVKGGTYSITAPIYYTSSNQALMLDPAVVIQPLTSFEFPAAPYSGNDGWGIFTLTLNTALTETYSNVYLFGNGAEIYPGNTAVSTKGGNVISIMAPSTLPQPRNIVVMDLQIIDPINNFAVYVAGNIDQNSTTSDYDPLPRSRINNVLISGIYIHAPENLQSGMNLIALYGSTQGVKIQQCYVDCGAVYTSIGTDYDPIIINSATGDTHDVLVEDCTFISNEATGQVFEIVGGNVMDRTTEGVYFKNCAFIAALGGGGPVYAGNGGGYIDQNNGQGATSYVRNITFDNCRFAGVGITLQSTHSDFGYIKFINGSDVPPLSGSITGISPNGGGAAITVGASPFSYTNGDGFEEYVVVSGGTVSAITLDGISTGQTAGVFILGVGDTLEVTYSAAPTMTKIAR
jgi:hypothetical protein